MDGGIDASWRGLSKDVSGGRNKGAQCIYFLLNLNTTFLIGEFGVSRRVEAAYSLSKVSGNATPRRFCFRRLTGR